MYTQPKEETESVIYIESDITGLLIQASTQLNAFLTAVFSPSALFVLIIISFWEKSTQHLFQYYIKTIIF